MRVSMKLVAGLALAGVAVPALAQFGPPPPPTPQKGPARVWNDQKYVPPWPVISADLGVGGVGQFTGVYEPEANKLCYMLSAPGVAFPTAAHIHIGGADATGAPVLTLKTPAGGWTGDCVEVKPELAKALLDNPDGYYVNVHNAEYPAGAVRGQLTVWNGAMRGKG